MIPVETDAVWVPAAKTRVERSSWELTKRVLIVCTLTGLTGAALFSEFILSKGGNPLQNVAREIADVCREPDTQWIIVLCLGIYTTVLLYLNWWRNSTPHPAQLISPCTEPHPTSCHLLLRLKMDAFCRAIFRFQSSIFASANFWLGAFLLFVLLRYVLGYETAAHSTQIPVLLANIVFGKAVALWAIQKSRVRNLKSETRIACSRDNEPAWRSQVALLVLLLLLTCEALRQPESAMSSLYRGVRRWEGAWYNPNIYGLLMGVGTILSFVFLVLRFRKGRWQTILCVALCLFAAVACGMRLFKSYSRGALVGEALAVGYLLWQVRDRRNWLRRNWIPLFAVALSVIALCFWQFRFSQLRPARRIFSMANPNDFSWRNRVSAWNGALQMMLDRPFIGFGWGETEIAYDNKYRAPRLNESAAIQMNNFFTLGTSAGVPALICLIIYLVLALTEGVEIGNRRDAQPTQIVCRAGALVLLTGFWFDGVLFKMATAGPFWILIELGRED